MAKNQYQLVTFFLNGKEVERMVDVHRTRTGRLGGRIVPAERTRPDRGIRPAARRHLNRPPKGRKLPNYGKSPASPSGEAGLCCVQQEWGAVTWRESVNGA